MSHLRVPAEILPNPSPAGRCARQRRREDVNATCGDGIGGGWRYRVVAVKTGLDRGEDPRRNDDDLAHEGGIDPLIFDSPSPAALDARRVTAIRPDLLVYAALFFTEGTGLVLQKHRRPGALRIGVLLSNLAIVWYLARSLRRGS
jgi:hypothetical protein